MNMQYRCDIDDLPDTINNDVHLHKHNAHTVIVE